MHLSWILRGWWWAQYLHPGRLTPTNPQTRYHGGGYWAYSGILSIGGFLTAPFLPLIVFWRHHNCHVAGCWRVGHVDPLHNHPACRRHHSLAHKLEGGSS